jgi:AdoMet-dependent rRNA methyltransferase SPB1
LFQSDNDDNPLMVDLIDKEMKKSQRTNQWFSNPAFSEIREREMEDEDEEINQSIKRFKGKLATGDNSEEDSGNDDEDGLPTNIDDGKDDDKEVKAKKAQLGDIMSNGASEGGEKIKGLDPAGLAIGSLIVQSRKKKQELIDSCYNRWVHNDPTLPDWFMEDENAHTQKQLPITKDLVNEYRKKLKEINARPIKKIAEAKARKKRRLAMKLDKARAKAQVICEASDVTDQEKVRQIKGLYKKAGFIGQKKKEVQYVVAKKGLGKRVSRPAGVSGRFKVVDPRMKKDNRREKIKHKNSKKKGKKR